jgi:hypothetical protein
MGGLAAVLALAVVAVFATSSASAATLCKENANPCPEDKVYPTKEIIKAALKAATTAFLNTPVNATDFKCAKLTWEGESLTDLSGEFSSGSITSVAFPGVPKCETNGVPPVACGVVNEINLPFSMGLVATGGGNGTFTVASGGSGTPGTEVVCAGSVDCIFSFKKAKVTVTGGATATAKESITGLERAGKVCPKEAEWTAEYDLSPAPLFVVSKVAPPVLCEENKEPCPIGTILGAGTAIAGSIKANVQFNYTFSGSKKEQSCTGSTITGKTTEPGKPLIGELTELEFAGCAGGACAITGQRLPYKVEVSNWINTPDGSITWSNKSNGRPAFRIKCGLFEECIYGTEQLTFDLTGGNPAEIHSPTKVALVRESGSSLLCSETATWEGFAAGEINWEITAPKPVYVRS